MPKNEQSHIPGLGSRARAWVCALALIAGAIQGVCAAADNEFKSLMQKAFDLHERGDFSAALPLLRNAYTMQPEDYFVNLLLGIDSLRTGEAEASIPFLKRASRLRPGEEIPLAYLGEAYARQEIYGSATESYLKAIKVASGSDDSAIAFVDFALTRFADISASLRSSTKGLAAEYRLRGLALGQNDPGRLSRFQRAADLDPGAPGIWADLARASLAAGDASAAADYNRRAQEADPNDLSAWIVDAQLAAHAKEWKKASERINALARRSPQTLSHEVGKWPWQVEVKPSAVSDVAARFFTCIQQRKAPCQIATSTVASAESARLFREQRWEQLIKRPLPNSAQHEAWLWRGIAFASLEDCAQAIPALERGLTGTSADTYDRFWLSWCYTREAGRTAQQVQETADDEAPIHIMRGDILLRLQAKPELAVAEYQQALTLHANDPSVLERIGEAHFGAGMIDLARENADAALKIDPQRLGAKRTLAKIAIQERDYTTALPYLREIAARDTRDVSGRVELGKACAQTGALDEAWQNLAPALDHGYPDEKGSLHYLLGTVLKKMGRTADAEQAFAAATQLSEAFQHKSYRDQDPDAQP